MDRNEREAPAGKGASRVVKAVIRDNTLPAQSWPTEGTDALTLRSLYFMMYAFRPRGHQHPARLPPRRVAEPARPR